ncbi:hypothetical protein EYZ11_011456 [Aspergillus tanneri]|uniref:Uncharacterized protein n=1 Tax=Aspergillus tanneri TaxID=1220188 RepID=A0A4S3J2R6_9EURO|nr:hypothetical protein EYZ11_011456 [Aspergillus tanneri]
MPAEECVPPEFGLKVTRENKNTARG